MLATILPSHRWKYPKYLSRSYVYYKLYSLNYIVKHYTLKNTLYINISFKRKPQVVMSVILYITLHTVFSRNGRNTGMCASQHKESTFKGIKREML